MTERMIKRALLSVYDKTGIVAFAKALTERFGVEVLSTGGTARALQDAGVPVTLVEQTTGFPEMMDGRVKTLHPRVHAGILADRSNPAHMRELKVQDIAPIDMVVVNLYPFEKTVATADCGFEQAIEMIDIGGPTMVRAAAKNHAHVWIVPSPTLYESVLAQLAAPEDIEGRRQLMARAAIEAFWMTSQYDAAISAYLSEQIDDAQIATHRTLHMTHAGTLRYGENPHCQGHVFGVSPATTGLSLLGMGVSEQDNASMSYNNYADADAALALCAELTRGQMDGDASQRATCVFVKHTNACGVSVSSDPIEAYRRAYLGDPNAAMGGILACDFPVDEGFADAVMNSYARWGKAAGAGGFFVEVWVAPSFAESAVSLIRSAKAWGTRVRLLAVGSMDDRPDPLSVDIKPVAGGMLMQSRDLVGLNENQWQVVTQRKPSGTEMADLRLAWLVCKHTKSNAITICKDGMLLGGGAGQMSRVMSCRIASWLAEENGHGDLLTGACAASDAFFPFRDGPDILADAGVSAIIQPGGSKRDEDTIAACDERGIAMVLTGTRHFKH